MFNTKFKFTQLFLKMLADLWNKEHGTDVHRSIGRLDALRSPEKKHFGQSERSRADVLEKERVYGLKKARRSCRLNIISALDERQITAPFIFEGNYKTEIFLSYAEQIFLKTLTPGKTVIMDNACFPKSQKLKEMIENAGCQLLYLPPYSPDYNPIEHHWFGIKNAIRKLIPKYGGDLYACATEVFA